MGRPALNPLKARWQHFRSHFWRSLAFDAVLIAVVFYAVHAWQTRELPIDQPAPETVLALLDGSGVTSATVEGQAGIVYFFAPWCFYCKSSIGNVESLLAREQVSWATAVALDYANTDEVQEFIDKTGVTLPVLMGNAKTASDWSIRGFPTYYVIDAEGRIASRSVGYSTLAGMWLRHWLAL